LEALVAVTVAVDAVAPTPTAIIARAFAIAAEAHRADTAIRNLQLDVTNLQHELQALAIEQHEVDRL
jgi:hypothetical protein